MSCLDIMACNACIALIDCIEGSALLTSILECFGSSLMPIGG